MNGPPHSFAFTVSLYSGNEVSGKVKYFVDSGGASRPRSISLIRDSKGHWFVSDYEELLQDIRRPAPRKK